MADCTKCNKKLGAFSKKYKVENDVYCPSCYSDYLKEAKQRMEAKQAKSMEIIRKYVKKYVLRLTPQEVVFIDDITKWPYKLIIEEYPDDTVLEICEKYGIIKKPRESLKSALIDDNGIFRSLNALSAAISFELQQLQILYDNFELYEDSYELGLEKIPPDKLGHVLEKLNTQLTFVKDLEKLIKLCLRDGVDNESVFNNIINSVMSEINSQIDDAFETTTNEIYHKIDLLLGDTSSSPDKIIKKYLAIESPDEVSVDTLKLLLDKFGLSVDDILLSEKIEDIQEELELDKFEKKLDRPRHLFVKNFDELTPFQFEDFLADLFNHLKYDVIKTSRTGDQGADLILIKNDKRMVVQVKKYSGAVDNSAVQQVVASKPYYEAEEALVVTNSTFTPGAIELAKSNGVILWDKEKLMSMVSKAENEFLAYQQFFSNEIISWVDREQLIKDWLEDYGKLRKIGE
ncbi:MAG: restriction endonuclease, partial [Candidatus Zixiibacteriota bacterium]